MSQKISNFIQAVLLLVLMSFAVFLLRVNFPLSGQQEIRADFFQDQKMLTKFGPEVRLKNENNIAVILESPVYFDLRSMPWFSQAQLEIIYKEEGLSLEGIGGQTAKGWAYNVNKPSKVNDLADGWKKSIFSFDLTKIYGEKNVRRFIISTLPATDGLNSALKIKSLTIILKK